MTRAAAIAAVTMGLTACGDQRLTKLHEGMPADSVAIVLKDDAPHRKLSYLTAGRQWDVRLYSQKPVAEADSVAWRALSPVVLTDGKVVAWGWGGWEKLAAKIGVPVPSK